MADALVKHTESARDAAIVGEIATALKNKETIDTLVDEEPKTRRVRVMSGPVNFSDAEREAKKKEQTQEEGIAVEPLEPLEVETAVTQPSGQRGVGLRRRPRRERTVSSPAVGGVDLWSVSDACAHLLPLISSNLISDIFAPWHIRRTRGYKVQPWLRRQRHLYSLTCRVELGTVLPEGKGCHLIWVLLWKTPH